MDNVMSPYKLDEAGGIYFTRQLEYIKSRAIEEKLVPLTYAQFIPVSGEMPLGATQFTFRTYKGYGLARMISDYAKDFPRVEIGATETTITAKDLGASYGYTISEIRRAQYAGVDLEARKASAVRRAIEQKINDIAWKGDSDYGLQGLIGYPGITEVTIPNTGSGSTKTWSTKTADQIIIDLNLIKNGVYITTNGIEMIDTILIPHAQMDLIKNTRMGSNTDTTVYEFFVRNNPGITLVGLREMDSAYNGVGSDTIYGYKRDSEHLEFQLPLAFEQFDAQQDGLEFKIPCMARVAGVVVYYPLSICWGQGI